MRKLDTVDHFNDKDRERDYPHEERFAYETFEGSLRGEKITLRQNSTSSSGAHLIDILTPRSGCSLTVEDSYQLINILLQMIADGRNGDYDFIDPAATIPFLE